MKLPDLVAVMPLPNAVLFPRVFLPLYIFEPRYKKMLADCLKTDRVFAVALLQPDPTKKGRRTQPYPVASVGVIRTCISRPDGSANLILEGVTRVRIVEYTRLRPYRLARVEPLESFEENTPPAREQLVATVTELAQARAKFGAKLPKPVLDSLLAVENAGQMSDLVSYALLEDDHLKQQMLETLDVNVRFGKLVEFLHQQTRQFELWKTLQGKLSHDDVGKN